MTSVVRLVSSAPRQRRKGEKDGVRRETILELVQGRGRLDRLESRIREKSSNRASAKGGGYRGVVDKGQADRCDSQVMLVADGEWAVICQRREAGTVAESGRGVSRWE